jgi:hypothetical protein
MADYRLPFYPWFLNDWLASPTRENMTAEQRGIYRDMLDLLYQYGGSLEMDQRKLERKLIITPEEFERSFPATLQQLRPDYDRPGFLTQDKVIQVIEKSLSLHAKRRRAGLLGVEAKKRKREKEPLG